MEKVWHFIKPKAWELCIILISISFALVYLFFIAEEKHMHGYIGPGKANPAHT